MTLQEILNVIDTLPREEVVQIQHHIAHMQHQSDVPFDKLIWEQDWIQTELRQFLQEAQPIEFVAGTMDADKFLAIMQEMHDELTPDDIEAITNAMNEE